MTAARFIHIDPLEVMTLPGPRRLPLCEIELGREGGRWRYATTTHDPGNGEGHSGPLGYWTSDRHRVAYDTREEALRAALAAIRKWAGYARERRAKHLAWCAQIEAGIGQGDLFGEAA